MGKRSQKYLGNDDVEWSNGNRIHLVKLSKYVPDYLVKLRPRSSVCSLYGQKRENAPAPRLSRLASLNPKYFHSHKIFKVLTIEEVIKNTKSKQATLSLKMKKILIKIPIVSLPRIGEEKKYEYVTTVPALSSTINGSAEIPKPACTPLQDALKPNKEILDSRHGIFVNTVLNSSPLVTFDPESNKCTPSMSVEYHDDTLEANDPTSTLTIIEENNESEFVFTQASDLPIDSEPEPEPTVLGLDEVYMMVWMEFQTI